MRLRAEAGCVGVNGTWLSRQCHLQPSCFFSETPEGKESRCYSLHMHEALSKEHTTCVFSFCALKAFFVLGKEPWVGEEKARVFRRKLQSLAPRSQIFNPRKQKKKKQSKKKKEKKKAVRCVKLDLQSGFSLGICGADI